MLSACRGEQLVAIALIVLLTWTNTRGLEVGKLVAEYVHVCQDRGPRGADRYRSFVRLGRE